MTVFAELLRADLAGQPPAAEPAVTSADVGEATLAMLERMEAAALENVRYHERRLLSLIDSYQREPKLEYRQIGDHKMVSAVALLRIATDMDRAQAALVQAKDAVDDALRVRRQCARAGQEKEQT